MSHSTGPTATAAANLFPACPQWCDPRACRSTDTDTYHSSIPVPLNLTGYQIEFMVVQRVDHAFPHTEVETRIHVEVTDVETAEGDPHVRHATLELSVDEWDRFVERVTIERNRARFLSAPSTRCVTS